MTTETEGARDGRIAQRWRGGLAMTGLLLGTPFVFARIARAADDPLRTARHRRAPLTRHAERFLDRCRINLRVEGRPPEVGSGVVVSHNETSFADIAAYFAAVWPHVDRLAGADVYAYMPFARAAVRRVNVELVPRGKRAATQVMMDRMVTAVKGGERLGWGGEGRLSGRDGVGRFKIGGSLIAIRAQVPVVPVVIHGGHTAFPLGSIRARGGVIRVRFCDPVSTGGLDEGDARDLADRLQAEVTRQYEGMAREAARA